jgi:hypothetical protein
VQVEADTIHPGSAGAKRCHNAGVRDFHLDPENMSTSHGLSGGVQRKRSAYVILLANFDFLASLGAIWISTTTRTALETVIFLSFLINGAYKLTRNT